MIAFFPALAGRRSILERPAMNPGCDKHERISVSPNMETAAHADVAERKDVNH